MIQDTSLEAFDILKPSLGEMQEKIYNIIASYPNSSNHDISKIIDYPINSVTPRVKELRDKGLVVFGGYKNDESTNRKVMTWTTP